MKNDKQTNARYTSAGTDIEAMKEQSRRSGLTYNEAKAYIARTTGGHGTNIYSDTDVEEVKRKNQQSGENARNDKQ
ncbi:gamma-type small acid-soluble spore protein [Lentibacillus juripiscarius]|uniref:Gamma-type small acid-soluble spore protein n=1 Tax=Lentibacillus juripiscarius TaxID=257446 RepID=A0ABW5V9X9_9BACI